MMRTYKGPEYMRSYRAVKRGDAMNLKLVKQGVRREKAPHKSGKHISQWQRGEIVAYSAIGDKGRDGKYTLTVLANSVGESVWSSTGLETEQCLQFLYEQGLKRPHAMHVWYRFDHAVNMMLADITADDIFSLMLGEFVDVGSFRVWYTPGRTLRLEKLGWSLKERTGVYFSDVSGFFQCSLYEAQQAYAPHIEDVSFPQRNIFIAPAYHTALTVAQTFDAFREACIRAGLPPLQRYDGAGAIATALLQQHGVKHHTNRDLDTDEVFCAYFGGRNELTCVGTHDGPVYSYDINSAYPNEIARLPSLQGASWRHLPVVAGDFPDNWPDMTLVHVRWHCMQRVIPLYPLPYRDGAGEVSFPSVGEGWYWLPEVKAAMAWSTVYGEQDNFEYLERLELQVPSEEYPFGFILDLYERRRDYKRVSDPSAHALKVGLNAISGKLAQQGGVFTPRYTQFVYAGYTNARVRARLMLAALQAPQSVVMLATDAIYSTKPLALDTGDDIGQWEAETHDGAVIVQSGVYWLGETVTSRGFGQLEMPAGKAVIAAWWDHGRSLGPIWYRIPVHLHRFVTMRSIAAKISPFEDWRTYQDTERILDIGPTGKREYNGFPNAPFPAHRRLVRTYAACPLAGGEPSQPHKRRGQGWNRAEDIIAEEAE